MTSFANFEQELNWLVLFLSSLFSHDTWLPRNPI